MQREILFRSWNESEKCFYYFKNGKYFEDVECEKESNNNSRFSWSNAEQFTGLLDKNGVKVFDGDLLEDNYTDGYGALIEGKAEVVFNCENAEWAIDNSFEQDKSSFTNLVRYFGDELKVIGNIHDNEK